MDKRTFGPTIFSFFSYLGLNVIFLIIPVVIWKINPEALPVVAFGCGIFFLAVVFLRMKDDINWVSIVDDGIVIHRIFSSENVRFKRIEKVIPKSGVSLSYTGRGLHSSVKKEVSLELVNGRIVSVYTAMWKDNTEMEFVDFFEGKRSEYGFQISPEKTKQDIV